VLFAYITRLASNEIFSTSNKIKREVGRAKDLSALRYIPTIFTVYKRKYYWSLEKVKNYILMTDMCCLSLCLNVSLRVLVH
jgi:hypothetical protein